MRGVPLEPAEGEGIERFNRISARGRIQDAEQRSFELAANPSAFGVDQDGNGVPDQIENLLEQGDLQVGAAETQRLDVVGRLVLDPASCVGQPFE